MEEVRVGRIPGEPVEVEVTNRSSLGRLLSVEASPVGILGTGRTGAGDMGGRLDLTIGTAEDWGDTGNDGCGFKLESRFRAPLQDLIDPLAKAASSSSNDMLALLRYWSITRNDAKKGDRPGVSTSREFEVKHIEGRTINSRRYN